MTLSSSLLLPQLMWWPGVPGAKYPVVEASDPEELGLEKSLPKRAAER